MSRCSISINETIAEVLRLDEEATPGPWDHHHRWGNIYDESGDPPFSFRRGETGDRYDGAAIVGADNVEVIYEGTFGAYDQTAGVLGAVPADAALIAYYRTAAPALAREVQRLRAEVERLQDGHRAGQEAMRERCAAISAAVEAAHHAASRHDRYHEGCRDAADEIESAIRALEVSHD